MSLSVDSRGLISEFPAWLSASELEAISWRADSGMVPWDVWVRLTDEERSRVGRLRQVAAQKLLRDRLLGR